MQQAILDANQIIMEQQKQTQFNHMATTVVAMLLRKTDIVLCHLGDSRCYQFDSDKLIQLTEDHTVLQKLLNEGKINQQQFEIMPMHHMISQALGLTEQPDIIIKPLTFMDNAVFLLCSDGLTNCLSDAQIQHILVTSNSLEDDVDELITRANDNGGIDNISVVLVKINLL